MDIRKLMYYKYIIICTQTQYTEHPDTGNNACSSHKNPVVGIESTTLPILRKQGYQLRQMVVKRCQMGV